MLLQGRIVMDTWRPFGGSWLLTNIYLCVEIKCVTTIYLLSLLFLCHCDLDFDVKEAEKIHINQEV